MSIVELDLVLVRELGPVISMILLVAANNVTERSSAEEVLLLQSQLFTAGRGVVGVEDAGDVFGGLPFGDGAEVAEDPLLDLFGLFPLFRIFFPLSHVSKCIL